MTTFEPTIENCNDYLNARTGHYGQRAFRYRAAAGFMVANGLSNNDTVIDIGAGWTEMDYCLRAEFGWRGRYIPVDGGIDGTNLNEWTAPQHVEWFVALEILEHLTKWDRLLAHMKAVASKGTVISTPNPRTTDVFAMDDTHVVAIHASMLRAHDMNVAEATFYGGRWSNGEPDSLIATYLSPLHR